jgi:phosphohistidine phosphatase
MTRELLILRHAKSAWDTGAQRDYDRPLAKRGRKAAPHVGRFLLGQDLIPDYVISSPAQRAKQTVIAVCEQMGIGQEQINWDDRIYGGWTSSLIQVLSECPQSARRVMIAGHNPGLESLLEELCNHYVPIPGNGKLMPTAAVAHLEILSQWEELGPASGRLISLTRARSLMD